MTFMEVIAHIQEQGEKVTSEKSNAIYTDKFLYARVGSEWEQRQLPIVQERFPILEDK